MLNNAKQLEVYRLFIIKSHVPCMCLAFYAFLYKEAFMHCAEMTFDDY